MERQSMRTCSGLIALIMLGMTGCGVWPVMTEENGRRPFAMGKSDQVFLPSAPQPVHLSEEFGVAYRQAVEGQIMNPQSAKNIDPIPGAADTGTVQYSLSRYQLMFENPPFSEFKFKKTSAGGGGSKTP